MSDMREIPHRLELLEKEIAALSEEVGVLASAIVDVTSQEATQPANADPGADAPTSNSCALAERISIMTSRVSGILSHVKSLHLRVEL